MTILRVKAEWTGFPGAPGFNVFHFQKPEGIEGTHAQEAADAVAAFYGGMTQILAGAPSIRVQSGVERIDELTGRIENIDTITPPAAVKGSSAGGYSGVSGAVVHWLTDGVKNGRRVRGRTFLVPLTGTMYDPDGTLTNVAVTSASTAATTLLGKPLDFVVWSRPSGPGASDGSIHPIVAARVPDKAAVLRSRRD